MRRFAFSVFLLTQLTGQFAPSSGRITILGIRVSFQEDSEESTTGDGTFLTQQPSERCGDYFLDPPPHDRAYFEAQLRAADSYFRSVSKGSFGIDLSRSRIVPEEENDSYRLDHTMSHFHPYGSETIGDKRLAELFQASLQKGYEEDTLDYDAYDVIAVFHAGIGQDFSLPFLDPTPEDVPSAYIDLSFLAEQLDTVTFGYSGIILPETQNHLLYDIADDIFSGVADPCDYQFGLTGTFALMVGFAIGLPPLWNTDSGESGVGSFTLMDQGSNNGRGVIPAPPNAWSRIHAGWELPTVIRPTRYVALVKRDSLSNQIARTDINASEYFLIENRNNWIYPGVDMDSLRWRNFRPETDSALPNYVQLLMDSVDVEIDSESGVIVSVPNYDLGLPSSGLLIWHIDENKIYEGLPDYSVNGDREHRGIDLEEADGAQDIGYASPFVFVDPSSGLWSDMWFDGNSEYYFSNPGFKGQPPSFGPDTRPDTRSNNGSDSYIEINDISEAGETMTFLVENSLVADGFPDTSLHFHFFYDFSGDGVPEIIGGKDSLWWSPGDSIVKNNFFALLSDSVQLAVTNYETPKPKLVAVVGQGLTALRVLVFNYDTGVSNFSLDWSQTVQSGRSRLPYVSMGFPDSDNVLLSWGNTQIVVSQEGAEPLVVPESGIDPRRSVVAQIEDPAQSTMKTTVATIENEGGLTIEHDGETVYGLENDTFQTVGAVDFDLDGRIEIVTTDVRGYVYVVTTDATLESGFPVPLASTSPVLAKNLFGDDHLELVVQVDSSDVVVLDWQGQERFRLANPKGSDLRMLGPYGGLTSIATRSTIWLFDSTTVTGGNEWPYVHHDPSNRRTLTAVLSQGKPRENLLMDRGRTYNYPNPAEDGRTSIRVFVESADRVEIMIYDVAGFFVRKFTMDSPVRSEVNEVVWDVSGVESGLYFANVVALRGDDSESKILKIAVIH